MFTRLLKRIVESSCSLLSHFTEYRARNPVRGGHRSTGHVGQYLRPIIIHVGDRLQASQFSVQKGQIAPQSELIGPDGSGLFLVLILQIGIICVASYQFQTTQ